MRSRAWTSPRALTWRSGTSRPPRASARRSRGPQRDFDARAIARLRDCAIARLRDCARARLRFQTVWTFFFFEPRKGGPRKGLVSRKWMAECFVGWGGLVDLPEGLFCGFRGIKFARTGRVVIMVLVEKTQLPESSHIWVSVFEATTQFSPL